MLHVVNAIALMSLAGWVNELIGVADGPAGPALAGPLFLPVGTLSYSVLKQFRLRTSAVGH